MSVIQPNPLPHDYDEEPCLCLTPFTCMAVEHVPHKTCFWCGAKSDDNWVSDPDHSEGLCFIAGPNS